jgi:hypothetical protein
MSDLFSTLQWLLPVIVMPLIPVAAGLIGRDAIISWWRRRFQRN